MSIQSHHAIIISIKMTIRISNKITMTSKLALHLVTEGYNFDSSPFPSVLSSEETCSVEPPGRSPSPWELVGVPKQRAAY